MKWCSDESKIIEYVGTNEVVESHFNAFYEEAEIDPLSAILRVLPDEKTISGAKGERSFVFSQRDRS